MRISAKLGILLAIAFNSASAADESFQDRMTTGARGVFDQALGGMRSGKNAGQAWLAWTQFQKGDQKAWGQLVDYAKSGNVEAENMVAHVLIEGAGQPANPAEGVRWLRMAAESLPLAQYNLGLLHLQGRFVGKDESRAIELFRKSLEKQKIAQAMVRLMLYHSNRGEWQSAWNWSQKAMEMKNKYGYYYGARMLMSGNGAIRDPSKAMLLLDTAAEMYSAEAAALLGDLYARGEGKDKHPVLAAGWRMISTGMNRGGAGRTPAAVSGLSDRDTEKARAFASDWLATHRAPPAVEYEKTLPLM